MKSRIKCILSATALLASLAMATPVITSYTGGTISQVNYNEDGTVSGFLVTGAVPTPAIGTATVLLEFPRICGPVAALGVAGDSLTSFSGRVRTDSDGISTVSVTAFVNTTHPLDVFTLATETHSHYVSTAGTTTGVLNYDSDGEVNGFFFTDTASTTTVLVVVGSKTYEALVSAATVVTAVTGSLETNSCPGTVPVVEASLLNGTIHVHGHH
jgi:hypothetical protein